MPSPKMPIDNALRGATTGSVRPASQWAVEQRFSTGPLRNLETMAAEHGRSVEVERAHKIVSGFSVRVGDTYDPPATDLEAILADLNSSIDKISSACRAMRHELASKELAPTNTIARESERIPSYLWHAGMSKWTLVASKPWPIFSSRQLVRKKELRDNCFPLLAQEAIQKTSILSTAAVAVERALEPSFNRVKSCLNSAWNEAVSENPRPDIDWWTPSWARTDLDVIDGISPIVSPAIARLTTVQTSVTLAAPFPSTRTFNQAKTLPETASNQDPEMPHFQIAIDLDRDGGFVSPDKAALEVATIDLLGQLPGGRVKVDVIDPLQLGDSARFLFDLNDAGDRILSDAIWTTTEHIAKVLTQLEEHITFVTQKYLQGRDSLTEYNIEAGEIAEPYRLLVLYDYPSGFSRDGKHFDEEQLTRLERIAAVGRRAGVYIFAHVPPGQTANRLGPLVHLTPHGLGLTASPTPPTRSTVGHAATLGMLSVSDPEYTWEVQAHPVPATDTRRDLFAGLLRDLQSSETAKVDPSTIARLSQARHASDVQKGLAVESIVDVSDPATWWQSVSTDRLQLSFGRMGASDIARMEFNSALESSALIGGRTGSGKSYLIHALIMDAITRYSPEELTLYLCDLKEGVEFKQYADAHLPHARAIAVESNREFALSLLEALELEIAERGALFKANASGAAVNITQFRQESGQTWPRVMIVIDEFHKLFEQDDRLARRAMRLLERVIKEGRAFGIHTVLASQSLANVDASFKSLSGQIPYRLVLASSDNDSRILLGEDNSDAKLLTKAGEGILNAKGGARESNQRFQTTYWSPEQRSAILEDVSELARRAGFGRHPHVFEGNAEVRADDYEPTLYRANGQGTTIPVGAPMSMEPPVTTKLERSPGSNLLIVDVEGLGNLAVLITSLLAQRVDVTAIDFAAIEQEWEPAFDALTAEGLDKPNRRRIDEVVDLLAKEVAERHANSDYRAEPKVLTLVGVHRARELDPDDYDDDSLLAKIRLLVKDGPEVGIHVIAWADRKASLDRRFDSQTLREFGLRFLGRMSEDDSRSLADTEQAAAITSAQVVFDDFDKAVTVVARRLGFPGPEWIGDVIGGG